MQNHLLCKLIRLSYRQDRPKLYILMTIVQHPNIYIPQFYIIMRNNKVKECFIYSWPSTSLPSARDGLENKLIASKSTRFHHYSRVKRTRESASFSEDTIQLVRPSMLFFSFYIILYFCLTILSETPQKLRFDNHFQQKLKFLFVILKETNQWPKFCCT